MMGKHPQNRDYLEEAMASLANLPGICEVLLLRVEQIDRRAPFLDGLVSPMYEQIAYVMHGIKEAQQAHAKIWSQGFMK
jgi:hypothetical protein